MGRGSRQQAQVTSGTNLRRTERKPLPNLSCIKNKYTRKLIKEAYENGVEFRDGGSEPLVFNLPESSPIRQQLYSDIKTINHQANLATQQINACMTMQNITSASSLQEIVDNLAEYAPSASPAIKPQLEKIIQKWRKDIDDNLNPTVGDGQQKLHVDKLSEKDLLESTPVEEAKVLLSHEIALADREIEGGQITVNPNSGIIDAPELDRYRRNLKALRQTQRNLAQKVQQMIDARHNGVTVSGKGKGKGTGSDAQSGFARNLRRCGYNYYLARRQGATVTEAL